MSVWLRSRPAMLDSFSSLNESNSSRVHFGSAADDDTRHDVIGSAFNGCHRWRGLAHRYVGASETVWVQCNPRHLLITCVAEVIN